MTLRIILVFTMVNRTLPTSVTLAPPKSVIVKNYTALILVLFRILLNPVDTPYIIIFR